MISFDTPFYLLFIVLPLALPFVVGIVILVGYLEDELNRLIGFFTIKPVLAYPIWFYMTMTVGTRWYDNWFDDINHSFGPLLPLIPPIILSVAIIYVLRDTFTHWLAWLFLGLDILRMLNTLILASSDETDNFSVPFGLALPSIIAILALIIATTRSKTVSSSLSRFQE